MFDWVREQAPRTRAVVLLGSGVFLLALNALTLTFVDKYYPAVLAMVPLCILVGGGGVVRPAIVEPWSTIGWPDRVAQTVLMGGGLVLAGATAWMSW